MNEGIWTARVLEGFDAFNRGDHEALLRYLHPEVVMKRVDGSPDEHGLVRGRDAVLAFFAPDAFERQTVEALQVFEGERAVVVHARVRNRGAGSGLEMDVDSWFVYLIEDDMIRRMEIWRRREDAARVSGLEL